MNDVATSRPAVSIMIVAYNSAALISACINSLAAACRAHDYEILLVDNGDGSTAALVAREFPAVAIVPSQGNVGFAAGNNLLAAEARGRNLLLTNPDVELQPGAIDALLEAAERYPDAAAWGGVTLDREGRPDYGNSAHIPSLREMASRTVGRSLAALDRIEFADRDSQVEALSGSFVMFDRKAWDEVGGLDARYFLYCEEIDLFYRLSLRGYTFWRIAAARAFHDIGHGEAISPERMLLRAAGTMQFARLHWSKWRELLAFAFLWVGAVQRYVAGRIFGRWRAHLRNVGKGHRLIALRPGDWRYGYDREKGLLARRQRRETGSAGA